MPEFTELQEEENNCCENCKWFRQKFDRSTNCFVETDFGVSIGMCHFLPESKRVWGNHFCAFCNIDPHEEI